MDWLILIYKIPAEPSRYRASVWRKIKDIGAIYLQNSVCIVPFNKKTERVFRKIKNEIENYGGEGYLIKADFIGPENKIISLFNDTRDEEYAEIIEKCYDFFYEIDAETKAEHFTYAELEENEEDLKKLYNWFEKVRERDYFTSFLQEKTYQLLAACRACLDDFGEHVFAREDMKQIDQ
ncbi:ChrB domain-containing protein [Desulfallas sp. Bu1-1]|uniref:Chromate resistance protein ChrB n=1 Tax=Desulfallas sp. Bu1-1 TaxID=2787620 RepID=UPI00189CB8E8|nr:Chromate resistance protein ChrB [Desulfallas sp. Bu1-1]MBF7084271.1 ChrB domain-containing protein [Desulfallas sp. Bu1-1]